MQPYHPFLHFVCLWVRSNHDAPLCHFSLDCSAWPLRGQDGVQRVEGQVKVLIRAMYSTPPIHGAALAARVLGTPELFDEWKVRVVTSHWWLDRLLDGLLDGLAWPVIGA
jgi:hypothetical protein